MTTGERRPRRYWVGILLSLVASGLGQIYAGRGRRGLFFFLLSAVLLLLASGLLLERLLPGGVIPIVILTVTYNVLMIWDTVRIIRREGREYTLERYNRWYVYLLLVLISSLLTECDATIFKSYVVPSRSMESTILVGDRVTAHMAAYHWRLPFTGTILASRAKPERGDVVVFTYQGDPETVFVKRVVGIGGDILEVRDGALMRNGQEVKEPYAVWGTQGEGSDFGPFLVKEGHLFMMGDNRSMSLDSRQRGTVPITQVLGRVKTVAWSYDGEAGRVRWERFGLAM